MQRKEIKRERENVGDPKIVQTATEGDRSKEIVFAKMMQKKNHDCKQEYHISFIVYLLWMLGINLLLDYQMQDAGDRLGCMVLWFGMILWVSLFTERFYQCYFMLQGEHGAQPQNIMAVVQQFPFSVSDYGKYIRKQLCSWQIGIFCSTMGISGLGMLIFVRNDFYPVFLWETQVSGKELTFRILGIFVLALLMAAIPQWILQVKLTAAQRNQKSNRRPFHGTARGGSQKIIQEKKWLLICLEICFIIFLCAFDMIIQEWIHPVSRNGILFIQIPNLLIFAIIILVEGFRTWYQYLQKKTENIWYHQEQVRQRRKIAIQLCIGILLLLLPQFYYDTYYENRMEIRHFIYKKSYEWQDVASYEIYCPVWGSNIQLRLCMKDGSQKKVLKTNANYSEKYYLDYDSEYDFIKIMVEKLDALGVEGSLKDPNKISRKVDRKYVDEWEDWKRIRKMMEE